MNEKKYYNHVCACGCGGKIEIQSHHKCQGIPKYIHGHHPAWNKGKILVERESRICKCGCNSSFKCKITSPKQYIIGHHNRTKKHRENLSKSKIGKKYPKISEAKKGHYVSPETIRKIYESRKNNGKPWNSEESNRKRSVAGKGKNSGKVPSEETCRKIGEANTGKTRTEEAIQKIRVASLEHWQNPEYREKTLKAIFKGLNIKPNKPEQLLNSLLQAFFLNQYKYVGDGFTWIAGKCPDFINENKHKVIELFGDYWHSEEVTGIPVEQHVRERTEHFEKHGYPTLIVWECELKDLNKLIEKIEEFDNVKT